jgi:Flp pilus assembly protein TadG
MRASTVNRTPSRSTRSWFSGGRRGTAMAEFALVATPCFILFFAIMNFAMALYSYDFVCYGAQQGARYAMVHGTTATQTVSATDVKNYVNGLVVGVLDTTALAVTTTWSPDEKPGSVVTVVVSYNFKPLTSIVSAVNINLSRTAAMVISE